ncbi:MAG TPA: UbiX family flavin prenyltransferase [Gammaproteobacteria bacterium]|nr:UbiX family flavin prenyltransferase [Gammaproteobacteria bacterium]
MKRRIVVALTGASGAVYGVRLLEELREANDVETHLVVSNAAWLNLATELDVGRARVEALADFSYSDKDIGASIASGSFRTDAMVVAPCSMRTLAGVATGLAGSLITRAADVTLKERRRLLLVTREAPLHVVHLRNMVTVTEMGGIIFPPVPAFYVGLDSLDAMVDQTVGRVLELIGIDSPLLRRWEGMKPGRAPED